MLSNETSLKMFEDLVEKFKNLQTDDAEFSCLKALVLFNPGESELGQEKICVVSVIRPTLSFWRKKFLPESFYFPSRGSVFVISPERTASFKFFGYSKKIS